MRYREIPPPPGLSGLIHCVWHLESQGLAPVQPVVPDGRVEIVLHLGEPFSELGRDGREARQQDVMVGGQLTRPIQLVPSTSANVIGIRLTSWAAGALLPVQELTNRVLPLREVRRVLADRLLDVFTGKNDGDVRVDRVAQVLASAVRRPPSRLVSGAVRLIENGDRPVRGVAEELGVTQRMLQRRFREEVGVSPVVMRRITRFRRAFSLLSRSPRGIASAAASAGYFDEAHFIREFHRFAGASPKRFFGGSSDMATALLGGEPD